MASSADVLYQDLDYYAVLDVDPDASADQLRVAFRRAVLRHHPDGRLAVLVTDDLDRAQAAAARSDLFLAIGTSLTVYPVAALPEIAVRRGARLVICNAEETPFDRVADAVVREKLGEVLPALAAMV